MKMLSDVVSARGELFLGSRMRRLAERMQADVQKVAEAAGLPVQPSQYPLLATLDLHGAQSVGHLAAAVGQSQPTVTRAVAVLTEMGLVTVTPDTSDKRQRRVGLTAAGAAAMLRSKLVVWPRIETAVREMTAGLSGPLLHQIHGIEQALAERSLDARAAALPGAALRIREFSDDLAQAFYDINAAWITALFTLEPVDIDVLENPRLRLISPGGAVLFAEAEGAGVIGTCALRKTGDAQFELTKMGVLEAARGMGAGELLMRSALDRARDLGAARLYLLTNRKAEAAIRLYERFGFVHDADIMRAFGADCARCDVAMRYPHALC